MKNLKKCTFEVPYEDSFSPKNSYEGEDKKKNVFRLYCILTLMGTKIYYEHEQCVVSFQNALSKFR